MIYVINQVMFSRKPSLIENGSNPLVQIQIFCNLTESYRKQRGIKGYYKLRKAELIQK